MKRCHSGGDAFRSPSLLELEMTLPFLHPRASVNGRLATLGVHPSSDTLH